MNLQFWASIFGKYAGGQMGQPENQPHYINLVLDLTTLNSSYFFLWGKLLNVLLIKEYKGGILLTGKGYSPPKSHNLEKNSL